MVRTTCNSGRADSPAIWNIRIKPYPAVSGTTIKRGWSVRPGVIGLRIARERKKLPKKRAKLLSQLYHFDDLDPKFMVAIPPNQHRPSALVKILKAKGAGPKCYVMSTISELDGQEVDLETALERIVGSQEGALISCVPGRLGYFEDEDGRYILERLR